MYSCCKTSVKALTIITVKFFPRSKKRENDLISNCVKYCGFIIAVKNAVDVWSTVAVPNTVAMKNTMDVEYYTCEEYGGRVDICSCEEYGGRLEKCSCENTVDVSSAIAVKNMVDVSRTVAVANTIALKKYTADLLNTVDWLSYTSVSAVDVLSAVNVLITVAV